MKHQKHCFWVSGIALAVYSIQSVACLLLDYRSQAADSMRKLVHDHNGRLIVRLRSVGYHQSELLLRYQSTNSPLVYGLFQLKTDAVSRWDGAFFECPIASLNGSFTGGIADGLLEYFAPATCQTLRCSVASGSFYVQRQALSFTLQAALLRPKQDRLRTLSGSHLSFRARFQLLGPIALQLEGHRSLKQGPQFFGNVFVACRLPKFVKGGTAKGCQTIAEAPSTERSSAELAPLYSLLSEALNMELAGLNNPPAASRQPFCSELMATETFIAPLNPPPSSPLCQPSPGLPRNKGVFSGLSHLNSRMAACEAAPVPRESKLFHSLFNYVQLRLSPQEFQELKSFLGPLEENYGVWAWQLAQQSEAQQLVFILDKLSSVCMQSRDVPAVLKKLVFGVAQFAQIRGYAEAYQSAVNILATSQTKKAKPFQG